MSKLLKVSNKITLKSIFKNKYFQSLFLSCTVDITESRTRRSAQNETEEVIVIKEATAKIQIFEPAEENTDEDIPNISMIQDPKHIYIEKVKIYNR